MLVDHCIQNELGKLPQNLSRALVNIASKLTHTKDVRDLFIDLVEKVTLTPQIKHTQHMVKENICYKIIV